VIPVQFWIPEAVEATQEATPEPTIQPVEETATPEATEEPAAELTIPVDFWTPDDAEAESAPIIEPMEDATPEATGFTIPVQVWTPEASSGATQDGTTITIGEEGFDPATLEITAGTTVTWMNVDDAPHSITSHDDLFGSTGLVTDESFSFTFDTAGTFTYYDSYRMDFQGTIVVTEGAADADTSDASATESAVTIGEEGFDPETLEVTVGTTVTWTNADDAPHTVTSHDDAFASSGLVTDETFSFTFEEAGTYTYFDNYRPDLQGTIIVTEP
jgi:plastocyanin